MTIFLCRFSTSFEEDAPARLPSFAVRSSASFLSEYSSRLASLWVRDLISLSFSRSSCSSFLIFASASSARAALLSDSIRRLSSFWDSAWAATRVEQTGGTHGFDSVHGGLEWTVSVDVVMGGLKWLAYIWRSASNFCACCACCLCSPQIPRPFLRKKTQLLTCVTISLPSIRVGSDAGR